MTEYERLTKEHRRLREIERKKEYPWRCAVKIQDHGEQLWMYETKEEAEAAYEKALGAHSAYLDTYVVNEITLMHYNTPIKRKTMGFMPTWAALMTKGREEILCQQ